MYTAFARNAVMGADPAWTRELFGFALVPDLVLYLEIDVDHLVPRVLEGKGMDYWESGMHLALGSDIFDSFQRYQRRLIDEYNALAREFGFVTRRRAPARRRHPGATCASTSPRYLAGAKRTARGAASPRHAVAARSVPRDGDVAGASGDAPAPAGLVLSVDDPRGGSRPARSCASTCAPSRARSAGARRRGRARAPAPRRDAAPARRAPPLRAGAAGALRRVGAARGRLARDRDRRRCATSTCWASWSRDARPTRLDPDLRAALGPFAVAIHDRRAAAHAALIEVLDSPRCRRLLDRLAGFADAGRPRRAGDASATSRRPAAAAPRAVRSGVPARRSSETPTPEALHRLRVRVKRLRYALETLRGLGGKRRQGGSCAGSSGCRTSSASTRTRSRRWPGCVPTPRSATLPPATLLAIGALIHVLGRGAPAGSAGGFPGAWRGARSPERLRRRPCASSAGAGRRRRAGAPLAGDRLMILYVLRHGDRRGRRARRRRSRAAG